MDGAGEVVVVGEVEEQHVSGNENLQNPFLPDRKQDAIPVIQGKKKPGVSCWSYYSHQKSMDCERPSIGLCHGLEGVWDDDGDLNSFLP